jgi:Zn-dependent protease with chaperone function
MKASLGLVVALASFAIANALASLAVLVAWRLVRPSLARMTAAGRAAVALVLRLLPAAAGLAVGLLLVVPAWLTLEPAATSETAGLVLLALAALGAALVASGLARAVLAIVATRRVVRGWMADAEPLVLAAAPAPAYRIRDAFPAVCVVGILRPRLFVAGQVLDRLSAEEIDAVLAHEAGHLRARDNLKGLAVRAAFDGLAFTGLGRRLEHTWREAAESLADASASSAAQSSALHLAAALIKVARMAPDGARVALPVPALHTGDDFVARVEALVGKAQQARPGASGTARPASAVTVGLVAAGGALVAAALPSLLPLAHRAIEVLVHNLR